MSSNTVLFYFLLLSVLLISATTSSTLGAAATPLYSVGINIDPTNTQGGNATLDQLQDLGAGWVRIEFKDNGQGTNFNPSSFTLYDNVMRMYKQAGLKVLMILDYTTATQVPWHKPSQDWANYAEVFAEKAYQIATRYAWYGGENLSFEIWNEPDLDATGVPAVAFANLLTQTYRAVKLKGKSTSNIVMGGLASGNADYVQEVAMNCPNGLLAADQVGLHPYGQRPSQNWPSSSWGFGTIQGLLANYRRVTGVPFVISEVGTADMTVQEQFPSHFFAAVENQVVTTIWFCFSDGMVSPFGLLDKNGNKKPSWENYVQYVDSKKHNF